MPPDINQSDVTGTVNLADPKAVEDAVCNILRRRYPAFNESFVRQGFTDIKEVFWGRYPGYLQCDTPYHDLRHSLSTTLATARMVDGFEIAHGADTPALGQDECALAVILALFHDIGFIRRDSEAHLNGASLIHQHEKRSVDFTYEYLLRGPFAKFANQAALIHATNFAVKVTDTLSDLPRELYVIGQILGTADLVSQIGGRYYLERCHQFLFKEFVTAGTDRVVGPDGTTTVIYRTGDDLLKKTPGFFDHVVQPRLEKDLAGVHRYMAAHFDGENPYARGMQRNMDHLRGMITRNDFSGMRRHPVPMMPHPEELRQHKLNAA